MKKEIKSLSEKIVDVDNPYFTPYCWTADIKEFIKIWREITKSFVFGDNPPHFSINEDNIDEYFEEINKKLGPKLI